MTEALRQLIELLDLQAIEVNIFRGKNLDEHAPSASSVARWPRSPSSPRAGPSSTVACTLCTRTSSGRAIPPHPSSTRSTDLRWSPRLRPGGVVAIQHGRAIFNLQCSFHIDEGPGLTHQAEMPEVPAPGELQPSRAPQAPP